MIVSGTVLDYRAALAKNGTEPGNNVDPTSTLADVSGNGNHGTLQGVAYTTESGWASDPCAFANAGDGDNVRIEKAAGLDGELWHSAEWTFEVWVYRTAAAGVDSDIFNGQYHKPRILLTNTAMSFIHYVGGSHTTIISRSGMTSINNGWHHMVVLQSASGGFTRIYRDSVQQGADAAATIIDDVDPDFYYWGGSWNTTQYFGGRQAVLRIYPFALTPAQVAQNFATVMHPMGYQQMGMW